MLPEMQDDPFTQFKITFFEECDELLTDMEQYLTDIQDGARDSEILNAVFRVVHSIKAGAGAFSYQRMVDFTHKFEFLLDKLRDGDMDVDDQIIGVLFSSNDILVDLVNFAREGTDPPANYGHEELQEIESILNGGDMVAAPVQSQSAQKPASVPDKAASLSPSLDPALDHYTIEFHPKPSLFQNANEPLLIIRELSSLGTLKTKIDTSDLPVLAALDPERSYFHWSFELATNRSREDIDEVFEFVIDDCDLTIVKLDHSGSVQTVDVTTQRPEDGKEDYGYFVAEELLARGIISAEQLAEIEALQTSKAGASSENAAMTSDAGNSTLDDDDDDDFGFFVDLDDTPAAQSVVETAKDPAKDPAVPLQVAEEAPAKAAKQAAPKSAPAKAASAKPGGGEKASSKVSSIRVDIDRVDRLVNMVGEIVITHSMLAQELDTLNENRQSSLGAGIEEMSMHIRELQDNVMAIRMQPVKSVFARMPRIVRDVSKKLNKNVKLVTEGENTEVDKTVVEELADPLTHMIRNSLDHGLEGPDERVSSGKNPEGRILLSAEHRGGRIIITVADDGRGINRDRVRSLAIERGIIAATDKLTDEEIDNLIFAPGFSTAEEVTDLSGRGVGMDVVRRNIQSLGGRVSVVSEPGKGSRFQLTLPLTLAVLDGMVVGVGDQKFVIPINNIIETLRPKEEDLGTLVDGTSVIKVRGEYIRLVKTSRIFGVRGAVQDLTKSLVVLVEADGDQTVGIVVDILAGQQQVVIKSLETNYGRVEGIASATILGNGSVCLILDIDALATMEETKEQKNILTQITHDFPALSTDKGAAEGNHHDL